MSDSEAGSAAPPSAAAVLEICDGLLGEIGRRRHIFSWLREPGASAGQWLAVDAYYPGRRLVVVLGPSPHAALFQELVPARGLRLLELDVSELLPDRAAARAMIDARIRALGAAPPPVPVRIQVPAEPPAPRPAPLSTAMSSLMRPAPHPEAGPLLSPRMAATERAERLLATRRALSGERPRPPVAPRPITPMATARLRASSGPSTVFSVLLGIVLAAVMCAEVYLAVPGLLLSSGLVVLALGIVLDACARALGAVAATKLARHEWAWACVIIGSPAVAAFALFQPSGHITEEPAPLAGVIAVLALVLVVLALVARLLGI